MFPYGVESMSQRKKVNLFLGFKSILLRVKWHCVSWSVSVSARGATEKILVGTGQETWERLNP